MSPYEGIPSECVSGVRAEVEKRWEAHKGVRESEKAPSELGDYFKALNTTKVRPEHVDHAVELLEDALAYDDSLPHLEREHLRNFLDRPFAPDDNHEYDTLPKRRVSTTVNVPFKMTVEAPNDLSELFPNGLGISTKSSREQWRPRNVEVTKKMIIAEVIKSYSENPLAFEGKTSAEVEDDRNLQELRANHASLRKRLRDY